MNLDTIRKNLKNLLHQERSFYYCGMRGQNELFDGRIVRIYPRVFLIETKDHMIKCFSYSDFATRLLKIV